MTVLKNLKQELSRFRLRVLAAAGFVLFCFGLLVARLVYLQVLQHDSLSDRAEANRITVVPIVPNRGLIKDRNGIVLASNYSAYTLEITPSKVPDLESTIDGLAQVIEIQQRDRRRFKRLMEESKNFESLPIRTKLTDAEVARFTAQRFPFPGVEIKARLFRSYPMGEVGAHLLGYIGRINQAEKKAMEDWDEEDLANYRGTEYIGKLGLEQSYERELHGITGFEQVETSAAGRAVRRLAYRPPTPGNTLQLSIDIRLQALVEELYKDRRGALVAIDPRNGEVLAFVSKPSFDPNLFVDGIDADSWRDLNENPDKPLLNRALRGTYPPGSTFKPYMAMAALNTGKRSPSTVVQDNLTYSFGGHTFGSAEGDRAGPKDMRLAIVTSSNVYFYSLAVEMGVDLIHDQLEPFGFGRKTDIDLLGEVPGVLPSQEWKKAYFKRSPANQKWFPGETVSLGIGQGYNNFTMLQLATAISTLSSGGQRFKPRLVREIEDVVKHEQRRVASDALTPLPLRPADVDVIRNAMHDVTLEGTSRAVFAGAAYQSAGKTGTAQAIGLRAGQNYKDIKADERKRDHSLYIAFAPYESPTIALALIVENAGFGSTSAAPIARRVFDYVLTGQYPSEEDIALTQQGKTTAPVGQPRRAVDVPLPGLARQRGAWGFGSIGSGQRTGLGSFTMNAVFSKPSIWQRLRPWLLGFDLPLLLAIARLMGLGLLCMYSAGYDHGTRFVDHGRNMLLSLVIIVLVAQIPPQRMLALAIPLYTIGVTLLLATALFGITKKGATRWLSIGVTQIQPSELLKIATPLMLAWWFQKREGQLRLPDFVAAFALLALPVGLIAKQPDLGTAILVLSAGLYVMFFAGLSWKLIIPAFVLGAAAITTLVMSEDAICQPDVSWPVLREYQKNRVCTLLDPTKDPLGKGFHIIQGEIAIGSGGVTGKGFMKGTQTHLEFIPERTTDFIFAAFGEEFGLLGALALLAGFTALILRGLMIASDAPTLFSRLLAGAVTLSFFTYVFVNMGMVNGILPVVGVPLPFISYGGTAMVTLGLSLGMLMSIAKSRRFLPS